MKRKLRIIGIVLISLVVGILGVALFQMMNSSTSNPDGIIMEEEEVEDNVVVMDKEDGGTISEGNSIPSDINLAGLLPKLPPTSKRLNVIDNNQDGLRRIILKYQITRTREDLRNLITEDLNSKKWDKVLEKENGVIFAERDTTNMSIEIVEVENLKQLLTIVVMITE